jgi:hypothetical protein
MSSKIIREAKRAVKVKAVADRKIRSNRVATFGEKFQGYKWPQGNWKTKGSLQRAEYYANELSTGKYLKPKRNVDAFIGCLISDLYWDCYAELKASGMIKKVKVKK